MLRVGCRLADMWADRRRQRKIGANLSRAMLHVPKPRVFSAPPVLAPPKLMLPMLSLGCLTGHPFACFGKASL
eukprot:352068-Chlamydomonas_euryale.AAC.8